MKFSGGENQMRLRWAWVVTLIAAVANCFGQAGRLDPTFRPVVDNRVFCIAVQSDRKILISGQFTQVDGQRRERIARLHPDGRLDANFIANANQGVTRIVLLPGGKILATGSFTAINGVSRESLARLHPDGNVDESFASDFRQVGSQGLAIETNGTILVTGSSGLYRLSADGIIDNSFQVRLDSAGYLLLVEVLSDGRIIIAGNFITVNGLRRNDVARLLPDGTVDPTFDTSRVNLGTRTECVLPQPDGKLLVGGSAFTRLLVDGSEDPAFPYSYTNGTIGTEHAMAPQSDGKFIAGGNLKGDHILYSTNLIRYFPDGPADPSFQVGLGPNDAIQAVTIQADQRILVGGYFRDYDGSGQKYLARVLNDWPVLDSRKVGATEMELKWPAVYTNFVLQTASSVSSTNWITLTNSPAVISNMCVVTNTVSSTNQFFRLAKP